MNQSQLLEQVFNLKDLISRRTVWRNKWSKIHKDYAKIEELANSNPITQKCVNIWQAVADYYGLKPIVNISNSQRVNDKFRDNIQAIIDYKIQPTIKPIIKTLAEKGNCFYYIADKQLVKQEPDFVNLYWNSFLQKPYYYKLELDGVELAQQLQHGQEIYHLRNPFDKKNPLSTAPVENARQEVEAYLNIFTFVRDEFGEGLTGNVLTTINERFKELANENNADGVPNWAHWSKTLSNLFRKTHSNKARGAKVIGVPYADSFFKYGSNMRDMEANAILERLVELIANSYNLVAQDLGFGRTTNTNTVEFAEQQEEKVGKPLKDELELFFNAWLLPKYFGIETKYTNPDFDFCIQFEKPNNEDQQAKRKIYLELIKQDILSKEEKRKILIEHFDLEIDEKVPEELTDKLPEPETQEALPEPETERVEMSQKKKIDLKAEQKKIDKITIESPYYERDEYVDGKLTKKGIKPLIQNAIEKQVKDFIKKVKKQGKVDLDKQFTKAETFLPFPVLKSNILNFVELAKNEVRETAKKKGKKIKFKFDLNEDLQDYVEALTKFNLKGADNLTNREKTLLGSFDNTYSGFDDATRDQINTVIKEFSDKPIDELIEALEVLVDNMSANRAELIARMTVNNAVEKTRYYSYLDLEATWKRHIGVNDGKETTYSTEATAQGVVPIDFVYNHQIGDGKSVPLHFNERSSIVYGWAKEDLE